MAFKFERVIDLSSKMTNIDGITGADTSESIWICGFAHGDPYSIQGIFEFSLTTMSFTGNDLEFLTGTGPIVWANNHFIVYGIKNYDFYTKDGTLIRSEPHDSNDVIDATVIQGNILVTLERRSPEGGGSLETFLIKRRISDWGIVSEIDINEIAGMKSGLYADSEDSLYVVSGTGKVYKIEEDGTGTQEGLIQMWLEVACQIEDKIYIEKSSNDSLYEYTNKKPVTSTLIGSYEIKIPPVKSYLKGAYPIYKNVSVDLNVGYEIYNAVNSYLDSSYSIKNRVIKKLVGSYNVYNTVNNSIEGSYPIYKTVGNSLLGKYKIGSNEVYNIISGMLSHWIYDLNCGSNMDKLLMLMAYPLQDALDTVREASKMLRVLEAKGIWCDLNGLNSGVKRDGKTDAELIAVTATGGNIKDQSASFDTIVESLAAAIGVNHEDIKMFEGPRHLSVEVNTDREIAFKIKDILLQIKAAGIIIDDIIKLNGKDLILAEGDIKDDLIHGFTDDPEAETGVFSEVVN